MYRSHRLRGADQTVFVVTKLSGDDSVQQKIERLSDCLTVGDADMQQIHAADREHLKVVALAVADDPLGLCFDLGQVIELFLTLIIRLRQDIDALDLV